MKILFPTDGSTASVGALRCLLARLGWFAQPPQIALLNVHLQIPYPGAAAWAGKEVVHKYYEDEGNAALAPAAAVLEQEGVAFERVLRVGDPAREIVKFAGDWQADLIAIGRHGHTALQVWLMGSVAQKVIATSSVPVLLVDRVGQEE